MYLATYKLDSWAEQADPRAIARGAVALTQALVVINLAFLEQVPHVPFLLDSGVVYREERNGEELLDIPAVLRQGHADCEDLAAWRAAELIHNGVPAWIECSFAPTRAKRRGPQYDYHLFVGTPFGPQDPSVQLGMR